MFDVIGIHGSGGQWPSLSCGSSIESQTDVDSFATLTIPKERRA